MDFSRRTFMKVAAIGGAAFASDAGVKYVDKLVPSIKRPDPLHPVEWHTIATTCRECPAGCGMHVRHRDGRITKAEGNPAHPVNRGGLCARGQSALQGIYDPDRVSGVHVREKRGGQFRPDTWQNAFARISERLKQSNGRVAVMSRLETGTLAEIMSAFAAAFGSNRVLLYEAFGWAVPKFYHLPLIRNPDRSKLSKRKNPTNVLWYRQEGFLPEAVVNFLGMLGHSMPDAREIFTREEYLREFSWERVVTSGPVFDMEKFEWLNGMWIRRLPVEPLAARLRAEGFVPAGFPPERLAGAVRLTQERMRRLKDFADLAAFFAARLPYEASLLVPDKKGKPTKTAPETRQALERWRSVLADLPDWKAAAMEAAGRALADALGWKAGDLFTPLRVAVTCRRVSTPLFETMEVLGREECLARLDEAAEKARTLA